MNDLVFLGIGVGCVFWTVGLVVVLARLDSSQRIATAKLMRDALQSIVERTGELRRDVTASAGSSTDWLDPVAPRQG